MNAIVGASAQRLDESGSSEKRESSSVSTTLDRDSNTFLPASRKLPEWLKACAREDGSYDEDLATQLAIAEFHNIDRRGIKQDFNIRYSKSQAIRKPAACRRSCPSPHLK